MRRCLYISHFQNGDDSWRGDQRLNVGIIRFALADIPRDFAKVPYKSARIPLVSPFAAVATALGFVDLSDRNCSDYPGKSAADLILLFRLYEIAVAVSLYTLQPKPSLTMMPPKGKSGICAWIL